MRRRELLGLAAGTGVLASAWPLRAASRRKRLKRASAPAPLRQGSRLRVVNPGTWIDPSTDFNPLVERFAQQGWTLEIPETVRGQWQWFSGTDEQRRSDLEQAWRDPSLDGVIYLGGGWGAARVLEAGFRFPSRPLWALGSSDSSALLLAQWNAALLGAVHGSSAGPETQWQRIVDLMSGRPLAPLRGRGIAGEIASGPLIVTNLTVATHLIGTPWFPSLHGAILVLEDVGEAPYRVDRMLTQWRSAGLLRGLAGVGCGRFTWEEDDILRGDFSMAEILQERLIDLGIPLVVDLPLGHGLPNMSLPLGFRASLSGQEGVLIVSGETC